MGRRSDLEPVSYNADRRAMIDALIDEYGPGLLAELEVSGVSGCVLSIRFHVH